MFGCSCCSSYLIVKSFHRCINFYFMTGFDVDKVFFRGTNRQTDRQTLIWSTHMEIYRHTKYFHSNIKIRSKLSTSKSIETLKNSWLARNFTPYNKPAHTHVVLGSISVAKSDRAPKQDVSCYKKKLRPNFFNDDFSH